MPTEKAIPAEVEEVLLRFRYTIRIGRATDTFVEIKQRLSSGISRRYGYRNTNEEKDNPSSSVIHDIISDNAKRQFANAGATQVYIADYTETRGSLIISFFIIATSLITNYGSIRETADYFAEDIEAIFTVAQDGNSTEYDVHAKVRSELNRTINQGSDIGRNIELAMSSTIKKLEKKVLISYALTFVAFAITISFAMLNLLSRNEDAKNSESPTSEEAKLSRMIANEIRSQKIEDHLRSIPDTVYILRSH